MDARSVIAAVRDGVAPEPGALRWFAEGLGSGMVSDAQAGAFAMAVCLRGLGDEGRIALTLAMRDSGDVLGWSLPGPVVDKHSTGGIGDCTSLPLAPALAACGVHVPMISGRGLGHTGGTLDKLEAIPGYCVAISETRLRDIVAGVGCAIVGATGRIAPADKRLYAVRDVTATVESVDLITASILSKKLAAGLDALVLDVKVGSGAFLPGRDQALLLAQTLVAVANGAGCRTRALVTDMDQPLASDAGNAIEVAASMRVLTRFGNDLRGGDARLATLTTALGGELLALCGVAPDALAGEARMSQALASGAAAERFGRMVSALGGPVDFVERWQQYLPVAPVVAEVAATQAGVVKAIDGRMLGNAVVSLGGGRFREGDKIDHSVGLSELVPLGAQIEVGASLALVHAATADAAKAAASRVRAAYRIAAEAADALPDLVQRRVG